MLFVSKCIKKIFYYYFLKIIFDINTSKQFKNIKTKINLNFYEAWFESRYQKKIHLEKNKDDVSVSKFNWYVTHHWNPNLWEAYKRRGKWTDQ